MVPDHYSCTSCTLTYRETTNHDRCYASDTGEHIWRDVVNKRDDEGLTFHDIAASIADTVTLKNQQYGDSFKRLPLLLKILYPEGIDKADYSELALVVRVLDKINRVTCGDQGEESAWKDLAGYCLLALKQGM